MGHKSMKAAIKKNWTGFKAGVKAQYPGRDSNLKCEYIEGKFSDNGTLPFVLPIKNYIQSYNFADAVVVIESYLNKRVFSAQGQPLFSLAAKELEASFDDENESIEQNERLLAHYSDWHASRPDCPYAAAAYAHGLQVTGHSHRGTDWAHKVKPHQWQAMQAYNEKAQSIYDATRNNFQNHWYWTKNYFRFALVSGVQAPEIWRRFEKCVATNAYDYEIYDTMAFMMMPRWHGSFEDIEKVAQIAAQATQQHCGDMLYARVISSLYDFHFLPELQFDWSRLKKGFQDWLNLFPSDYTKTYFACSAYAMGEYKLTLELLESLDEFYIEAWDADEDIYLANSICREFKKNYPSQIT